MQAWKTRIVIVAVIILLPLEIALLVGLWPYLPIVGRAIAGTVVVACVCASMTMISWTWRRLRAPHLIVERDVVVMLMRDGSYHHLSAEQEAAKLSLPAPSTPGVVVSEERIDKTLTTEQEWQIIDLRQKGMSLRDIEKALSIPYNRVQRVCADWQKKLNGNA